MKSLFSAIALVTAGVASSASAPLQADDRGGETAIANDAFAKFAPRDQTVDTKLDFSYWSTALHWFVLRMGRSLREYEPAPDPTVGTRVVYGHDSPYRLEGNRVAFSLMPEDVKQSLTEYRRDLESLPDTVPLTNLSRNEQLAYWINLHNVAMIEQLALAYPVPVPSQFRPAGSERILDETPFITVSGVAMSPRDIRTKIVYPNWHDPKVIYGFWHGDIGGPSIDRNAYAAETVGQALDYGALEFVNSLRGVQASGEKLLVSELYEEARPFYFPNWPDNLRAHLAKYAEGDVATLLARTRRVDPRIAETDIADLSKAERDPQLSNVVQNGNPAGIGVNPAIARLIAERRDKLERFYRRTDITGKVTVQTGEAKSSKPPETVR